MSWVLMGNIWSGGSQLQAAEKNVPGAPQMLQGLCLLGRAGLSNSFLLGPRQPCGCLQRAKCNFRTV